MIFMLKNADINISRLNTKAGYIKHINSVIITVMLVMRLSCYFQNGYLKTNEREYRLAL